MIVEDCLVPPARMRKGGVEAFVGEVVDDVSGDRRRFQRLTLAFVGLGLFLRVMRYLIDLPLWSDEMSLAANLVDFQYGDLGRPLRYAQVCPVGFLAIEAAAVRLLGFSTWSLRLIPVVSGVASVFLFRHVAGRLVSGPPLLLAVAIFSVSWWPIGLAAEVKPYASDLFLSLALLALGLEWRRRPDQTAWLWGLAGLAVVAVPLSFPSVFVIGGVCLGLAPAVWRARRVGAWGAFVALAVVPATLFLALLPSYALTPAVKIYMDQYWADAFPPLGEVSQLPGWLVRAHTGMVFAYPIGWNPGGSTLTTVCFFAGVVTFWSQGRRGFLALVLGPLALCFLAAVFHRCPYGLQPRTMQFFAPAVCLVSGLGLDTLIGRLPTWKARRHAFTFCLLIYLALAAGELVFTLVHPYRHAQDQQARAFASWFWEEQSRDAEVVCARTDLGLTLDPRHWDKPWTDYYLCYQRIYLPRRRQNQPARIDALSDQHPLRCVFFNENLGASPDFREWMEGMQRSFTHRGTREYTVQRRDHGVVILVNQYLVFEFVPKPGAVALSLPTVSDRATRH
ncbi:MAG: hypothetical protein NVSMB9_36540 [Isosphaeraceae bacterium]